MSQINVRGVEERIELDSARQMLDALLHAMTLRCLRFVVPAQIQIVSLAVDRIPFGCGRTCVLRVPVGSAEADKESVRQFGFQRRCPLLRHKHVFHPTRMNR